MQVFFNIWYNEAESTEESTQDSTQDGSRVMFIKDKNIDNGKAFDWGKTSLDYAKYRDIYPKKFYDKILERGLCKEGQIILDVGTGTGVLPRNMYEYGAKWIGVDISPEQIEQAKRLSENMNIDYFATATEDIELPNDSVDVITACQCFWYFNPETVAPKFFDILKSNGRILILYMAWLPFEDKIAGESEKIVLKYSPEWSGARERMHPIDVPKEYDKYFEKVYHFEYPLKVHFTRESWNGRVKACRGVGASLSEKELESWENEHKLLLEKITPEEFDVLHYAAITELRVKK